MTLSSTKTVREVVLELPQATRVFEKMKIDYCCGGNIPLGEACATAGVDVEKLERMLDEAVQVDTKATGTLDFQKTTLTELITYILDKHHVYTKDEMARLEFLVEKVIGAHGANHSELRGVGDLFQQLCADLKPHMFKEEQVAYTRALDEAGIPYFVAEFEESMTSFDSMEIQLETFVENILFS